MKIENIKGTREFIVSCQKYITGRTIDLGAGTAKYRDIIKKSSQEYVALDLFPGDNIDIVSDVADTGLPGDSFDTLICTQVLEHVPKPWLVANEIHRLLKQGGICIVTAPFIQASHADPNDYFRYTVAGLSSLFEDGGFQIIERGGYGKIASTMFDFIKMIWFSPYKKPVRGSWTFVRLMIDFSHWLDRFTTNEIVYGNSFVVARKK